MRFYKDGEELILSSKESALLLLFIKHPGQVYTKDMIYEQVWGTTIAIDDNAIMVYINRLRSKDRKRQAETRAYYYGTRDGISVPPVNVRRLIQTLTNCKINPLYL